MSRPSARLTAADFDPEVMRLFDQYVHGGIDRRRLGDDDVARQGGQHLRDQRRAAARHVKDESARSETLLARRIV